MVRVPSPSPTRLKLACWATTVEDTPDSTDGEVAIALTAVLEAKAEAKAK
jgi:hypothetical protein